MAFNKKANLLMDCDAYNDDCHTCVLANCKYENDRCVDKKDELDRGEKTSDDDKEEKSKRIDLTVAEFMK